MVAMATAVKNDDWIVRISITTAVTMMETYGVLNFGCVRSKTGGRSPCSDIPNNVREADSAPVLRLPRIETTTPMLIKAAPNGPRKTTDASAIGLSDAASPGSVPIDTICTYYKD
jgi:hypothetical protein